MASLLVEFGIICWPHIHYTCQEGELQDMPPNLALQVHNLYPSAPALKNLHASPTNSTPTNHKRGKKMIFTRKHLTISIAILAASIATNLMTWNTSSLFSFLDSSNRFLFESPVISDFIHWFHLYRHHRHHKHPAKSQKVLICDDFPPNIPPPETNTTVTLCVDRNGCCNFRTIQAAVDAVGNFSQKRTVIWINNGIY